LFGSLSLKTPSKQKDLVHCSTAISSGRKGERD